MEFCDFRFYSVEKVEPVEEATQEDNAAQGNEDNNESGSGDNEDSGNGRRRRLQEDGDGNEDDYINFYRYLPHLQESWWFSQRQDEIAKVGRSRSLVIVIL